MNGDPVAIELYDIRLNVLPQDAAWYGQRHRFEECLSPLYRLLAAHGFATMIDVGANHGLISILARRESSSLRVVCIEPDPRLPALIAANHALNKLPEPEVLNVALGAVGLKSSSFSLHPASTLDNRVEMPGWERAAVPRMTLDEIAADVTGPLFVKIDTQGSEEHVLAGASRLMGARADWLMKIEFAPLWMRSQGGDPVRLLQRLCGNWNVSELPGRIPLGSSIGSLFAQRIETQDVPMFVDYVERLDRKRRGWVDLLIKPQTCIFM